MPSANLLALIDDIATLLDDVAVMSKVAAKKTAGVLGDDLALNAEQVTGVDPTRELPVVWAVAKGSMVNKVIIVPAALGISAAAPWAILPLLMVGGVFLCYEGFEKVAHKLFDGHEAEEKKEHAELVAAVANPEVDLVQHEKDKIKGAVRTDFILSAEIIVISLGTLTGKTITEQALVLATVAVGITVGVYGLVAGIVKLDDAGLWLQRKSGALQKALGRALLAFAPRLMKFLSIAGTAAMFLVGGGIVVHGIGPLEHWVEAMAASLKAGAGGWLLAPLFESAAGGVTGIVAGAITLAVVAGIKKVRKGKPAGKA